MIIKNIKLTELSYKESIRLTQANKTQLFSRNTTQKDNKNKRLKIKGKKK